MKVRVDILRTTKIKVSDIFAILGHDLEDMVSIKELESELKESFGPLADGFKILWNGNENEKPLLGEVIAGLEVMRFEMTLDKTISANEALYNYVDNFSEKQLNRIDGSLYSELRRLGVWTTMENYTFKAIMKVERELNA